MVAGPRVVLKGSKKLQAILNRGENTTTKIVNQELKKATYDTENRARNRVPVITGRLQGSIKSQYSDKLIRGVVGSSVKYAARIEYGPDGTYKPDDNIPGSRTGFKPYLRPSLAAAMVEFNKRILIALNKSEL